MSEPKIVIGAGAAGLTAAAVCAERGGRVLLIEKIASIFSNFSSQ